VSLNTYINTLVTYKYSISSIVFAVFFITAAWPGWLSGDSYTQWVEATGQFIISDGHSQQLSLAWSLLFPEELGPTMPFLLQSLSYFVGIALIQIWIEHRSRVYALIFFCLIAVAPFTWTVAWISKDSFIVSLLALSTGLGIWAPKPTSRIVRALLLSASAFALGLAAVGRPYMFPFLLIWGLTVTVLLNPKKLGKWLTVVLAVSSTTFSVAVFLPPALSPPYPQYIQGSTALLDLARIECRTRSIESMTPDSGVIPRQFIVNGELADICSKYSLSVWDPLVWGDPNGVRVRLPISPEENNELWNSWRNATVSNFTVLTSAKVENFVALLTTPDLSYYPNPAKESSKPGGMGIPVEVYVYGGNFLSRGGPVLAVMSIPVNMVTSVSPLLVSGLFWIILLPITMFIFGKINNERKNSSRKLVSLLLASGLLWALAISFVGPAIPTRYIMPGMFMAFAAIFLVRLHVQVDRFSSAKVR